MYVEIAQSIEGKCYVTNTTYRTQKEALSFIIHYGTKKGNCVVSLNVKKEPRTRQEYGPKHRMMYTDTYLYTYTYFF
jgi:hypothetical protein